MCVSYKVLRKGFDTFDTEKNGKITCANINIILDMLGHATDVETVKKIVSEIDHQGKLMDRHVSVGENRGRSLSHPISIP